MPDTWITNITHYLDEHGELPPDIPREALQLAVYFGSIVAAVTSRFNDTFQLHPVRCRRRPNRIPCREPIQAVVHRESQDIDWHCPRCGDRGRISNWQGTPWDRRNPSEQADS